MSEIIQKLLDQNLLLWQRKYRLERELQEIRDEARERKDFALYERINAAISEAAP